MAAQLRPRPTSVLAIRRPVVPDLRPLGVIMLLYPLLMLPLQAPAADMQSYDWTVDVLVGMRAYDENEWAPVDEQLALGLLATWRLSDSNWRLEMGLSTSSDDATLTNGVDLLDLEANFFEATLGVRYVFELETAEMEPYISFGASWQDAEIKASLNGGPDESEDDQSFGLLLGGGLAFPFAERWRAGFDLRAVAGTDLEYGGVETNADYGQFSAFIGVAW